MVEMIRRGVMEYAPVILMIAVVLTMIVMGIFTLYIAKQQVSAIESRLRYAYTVGAGLSAIQRIPLFVAFLSGSQTVVESNINYTATAYCNGSLPSATVPPLGTVTIPAVCTYLNITYGTASINVSVSPTPIPRMTVLVCSVEPTKLIAIVSSNLTIVRNIEPIYNCTTVAVWRYLPPPVYAVDEFGNVVRAQVVYVS